MKLSVLLLLGALGLLTRSALAQTKKCYALVLGTGDMSAAFQAGVLESILKKTPADEVKYDVVSGVAGSSVNALIMASQGKGQEQQAVNNMKQFWTDAGQTPLYKDWWIGPWGALLGAKGLYDNSPLKDFVTKEFTHLNVSAPLSLDRELSVGIINVLNGNYSEINQEVASQSNQNLIDTIFSSFGYPGFYPPAQAFGGEYFDGASVVTLDILGAINKCKKLGVTDDKNIIVDAIITNGDSVGRVNGSDYRSLGMLMRFIEIYWYYGTMNGLERAKFAHPDVTYRHVIKPSTTLPWNYLPLSLNGTQIDQIIAQGVQDGAKAIEQGLNKLEDHLEYYRLKKSGKNAHKSFAHYMKGKQGAQAFLE